MLEPPTGITPKFNKRLHDHINLSVKLSLVTRWNRQTTSYCSEFEKVGDKNDRGALQAYCTICRLLNYCERKLLIKENKQIAVFIFTFIFI